MSQIVRAIMARDTGQRQVATDSFSPLFKEMVSITEKSSEDVSYTYDAYIRYDISVKIGNSVSVSADSIRMSKEKSDGELGFAIQRTKQAVVEAIFGEFREDFYLISSALYDRDFQKARSLLNEFQRKMYEVD